MNINITRQSISVIALSLLTSMNLFAAADEPESYGPVPTQNQLDWHEVEYYGLVCFSLNTYTGEEWGYGDRSPQLFDPSDLDTDQWARVAKESGMKGLILVAKHHNGFCLWPSKTTKYTVAASPWKDGKGDVLGDLSKSCKKYGLKLGVYVSPWDRNHAEYGREQYVKDFHEQWREVLTNYGEIFEVWFDGANGGTGYYGGAKENRTIPKDYYQYDEVFKLIKAKQPRAVHFGGPPAADGVRWVGNEEGVAGTTNWSHDHTKDAYWLPDEADTTILQPKKWYYNPSSNPRGLRNFVDLYYTTIGRNASLNLGLSIGPDGLIPERDVKAMLAQKKQLDKDFHENIAKEAKINASEWRGEASSYGPMKAADQSTNSYWCTSDGVKKANLTLEFNQARSFNCLLLQEYIALGQRIHAFTLEVERNGVWDLVTQGTTIGYKRILRFTSVKASKVRITFETNAPCLTISNLGIYNATSVIPELTIVADRTGKVIITSPEGFDSYYCVNDGEWQKYVKPFVIKNGGVLKSYGQDPLTGVKTDTATETIGLANDEWKIVSCSFPNEGGSSINAIIDGDNKTMWHTHGANGRIPGPHSVVIDLARESNLSGFLAMPRHDGSTVGLVDQYSFYVSLDGKDWKLAASGEFSNIKNNPIEQQVKFTKPMTARFIKFVAEHAVDDNSCIALCELGLIVK
jgi:alpha-L-fucosidase